MLIPISSIMLITILNLIYCVVTKEKTMLFCSIFAYFLPCFRFLDSKNISDIIILSVLLCLSVFLLLGTANELIGSRSNKAPLFVILNSLLTFVMFFGSIIKCMSNYYQLLPYLNLFSLFISAAYLILLVVIFCIRSIESKPQNTNTITYDNIKRNAKQVIWIESSVFISNIIIDYFLIDSSIRNEITSLLKNTTYITVVLIALIYFISTISVYKKYTKICTEQVSSGSLTKLCIMQIVSTLFFMASYFLLF